MKPKDKAWKTFSNYIRKRDCVKTTGSQHFGICYTCGKEFPYKELQCGHCISGRGNYVLLNEDLCRIQCMQCNILKSGSYDIFIPKIIRENSLKWFEEQKRLSRLPIKKDWKAERERYFEKYQDIVCNKDLPF
jgi:hypothetical protein